VTCVGAAVAAAFVARSALNLSASAMIAMTA
jgi:hypothetical protein